MKNAILSFGIVAFAALSGELVYAQERATKPAFNPFDRPSYMIGAQVNVQAVEIDAPVELELRTTLVTADAALANINGQLLSVGDSFAGHRVVLIEEGKVILIKDGQRVVLDVYARQMDANAGANR